MKLKSLQKMILTAAVVAAPVWMWGADARVTSLSGSAEVVPAGSSNPSALSVGLSVSDGSLVRTAAETNLYLTLANGVQLGIGPNAEVRISGLDNPENGIRIDVQIGSVLFDAAEGALDGLVVSISAPGLQSFPLSAEDGSTGHTAYGLVYNPADQISVVKVDAGNVRVVRDGQRDNLGGGTIRSYLAGGSVGDDGERYLTELVQLSAVGVANGLLNPPAPVNPPGVTPGTPPFEVPVINPGDHINIVTPDAPPGQNR